MWHGFKAPNTTPLACGGPNGLRGRVLFRGSLMSLIELGRHRIWHGDATDPDTYLNLFLDGGKFDVLFTDPPWVLKAEALHGINGLSTLTDEYRRKDCWLYVCASMFTLAPIVQEFELIAERCGLLHWCKPNPVPNQHKTHWTEATELIAYAVCGNPGFVFNESTQSINWRKINHINPKERAHFSEMPIPVARWVLRPSLKKNQVVFDPFLGTGATLFAAQSLDAVCFGIEQDERKLKVLINRWERSCAL